MINFKNFAKNFSFIGRGIFCSYDCLLLIAKYEIYLKYEKFENLES